MNPLDLQRKLIVAARSNPPGDGVPFAFEKRIMARLKDHLNVDPMRAWGHGLSKAAAFCVALALLVTCISFFLPAANQETLAQDFDRALYAAVDNSQTADSPTDSR